MLGIKYFGHFDLEELKYSNIIFSNAENYNINSNKNKIIIKSGDLNTFIQSPTLENLTIKFSTNHQVYKNNADKKNDNIYYWYFTKDNIAEKIIELEISKDPKKVELEALELGEDGYFGSRTLYLLYATIGVVLLISAGYIYIKIKKANN